MTPFGNRLAGQLSGGMKQKLGLTCALVHAPRVLLLDEPTTGVDPVSRREFWQILYSLRAEGVSMVISTAYLDEAERCDRLALFASGAHHVLRYAAQTQAGHAGRDYPDYIGKSAPIAGSSGKRSMVVDGVLLVGNGIHIHVDDAARRLPQLGQAIAASGLQANEIQQIETDYRRSVRRPSRAQAAAHVMEPQSAPAIVVDKLCKVLRVVQGAR